MEDGGGGYPELGLPPDGPGTIVSWDVTPAPQAGLGWRTENLSKAEVNTLGEIPNRSKHVRQTVLKKPSLLT